MKQTKLKKAIKEKFGSVYHFANVTGLSYWQTTNTLNGRISERNASDFLSTIEDKLTTTEAKNEKVIKPEEREFVRLLLVAKFKSLKNFCEKNPKFSLTFVSNVINGRRKRRDPRFENLLKKIEQ